MESIVNSLTYNNPLKGLHFIEQISINPAPAVQRILAKNKSDISRKTYFEVQKIIHSTDYNIIKKAVRQVLTKYISIKSYVTYFELLKVMNVTAKYQCIERAMEDGYINTRIAIPNIGNHYLKAEHLDDEFDIEKPEFLIYSTNSQKVGPELVAVEYAIPLDISSEARLKGFTGNLDKWMRNEDLGLWTCCAWVWKYNLEGIFNPTNPGVL